MSKKSRSLPPSVATYSSRVFRTVVVACAWATSSSPVQTAQSLLQDRVDTRHAQIGESNLLSGECYSGFASRHRCLHS